jgi:magnesium chelatase accessory protein
MSQRLNWERDGHDWPHRAASRFITLNGLRWHVQVMGSGPAVLLIHGTGASTHSWRDMAGPLAERFTVVMPDLPGHGFTAAAPNPSGYTLPGVAAGIAGLLDRLGVSPVLAAGHSAGAAVAARMCLDGTISPAALVSFNGALLPFPVIGTGFLAPAARFLATSSVTARAVSFLAGSRPSVERMLRSTGSRIDAEGTRLYARLVASPGHVNGALALMANWDLRPLARDLPRLRTRLLLVTGSNDGMVPSAEAYRVRALVPAAEIIPLRGLGHLAHEEKPHDMVALLKGLQPNAADRPSAADGAE